MLTNNNISYRVYDSGGKFCIDVPDTELDRCTELFEEQTRAATPLSQNCGRSFSLEFRGLIGIVLGGVVGALVAALTRTTPVPQLPAICAAAGGILAVACSRS